MRLPIAALLAAVALSGCAALFEPFEQAFLFRSRPAAPERYAAILERDQGVEEVRLAAADGTRLHGLLKRAPAARNGERFPLVIVFGGVARETSWMVGWGEKPAAWGGPKSIVTLPGGHRMVEWRAQYWRALGEFLGGLTAAQRRLEGSGTVQK